MEYFFTHRNGIVSYEDPELARAVWLRMRLDSNGRWEVAELFVPSDDRPLSSDDLRRIPIGRIQAMCNDPAISDQLSAKAGKAAIGLEVAARRTERDVDRFNASEAGASRAPSAIVEVPSTRPYPDEFYAAVAASYSAHARFGRPSAQIAADSGVPVSTVHRWIRQCRARGLLTPASPGRAG